MIKARILEKSEEKLWDEFIKNHQLSSIHQSSTWGHFQEKIPERGKYWIVILENTETKKITGGSLIIRYPLSKGYTWLYAARAPILDYDAPDLEKQMQAVLKPLKSISKKENSVFLRIDPALPENSKINLSGFNKVSHGFQPQHTLLIDLTQSEEDILKDMKPKGRYNIRLAEKKEVEIYKADPTQAAEFEQDLEGFYKILQETTTRDVFSGHDKTYYKHMLETLDQSHEAKLYLAKFEDKIIAGIIVTFFAQTATYYFGASSNEHRNVMAPYLLQWTAIQDAKKAKFKHYDFLGISPPASAKNHPWQGVTEFKKKFGGIEAAYMPAMEFAFKPLLYWLYRLYKKV